MRIVKPLLAAVLVAAVSMPTSASAQLVSTSPSCAYAIGYPGFSPTPYACGGAFAGNDANQEADVKSWLLANSFPTATLVGKTDAGMTTGPFSSVPGATSGTLELDSPISGQFALILKSSNQFSIYLFGIVNPISEIDFVTLGTSLNPQGSAQALSHASLWTGARVGEPGCVGCEPVIVPEPASYAMLMAGLFGMGAFARRRQQNRLS